MPKVLLAIIITILGIIILILGINYVNFLNKAHSTFEDYYAFRGCTKLFQKTADYRICQINSGQTIKIMKYQNKWYLDGDLPCSPLCKSTTPTEITPTPTIKKEVVEPIAQFKQRITKKFFGTYITPTNSPISPERFTGFHTGVDVEYTDVTSDVPVFTIADGTIMTSEYASGYGGVTVIKHQAGGQTLYAVYGHLRPNSMLKAGTKVTQGEQIGVLGTGYSQETDGERRHLHFGIAKTNTITGYMSNKTDLETNWIDPFSLYQ